MEESDKIKEDFEDIKKRIRELEKEVDRRFKAEEKINQEKQDSDKTDNVFDKKKYVRILVILVIIILVMDIIALVAYYKPDFSGIFKSSSGNNADSDSSPNNVAARGECKDGTREGECSRNKPYFCYQGELVKKAAGCGCPSGYKLDFQDCKKG